MSHVDTVRELASILNPQNEARPTVLLGAGASFSSGVPLADESVKRIARRYFAERSAGRCSGTGQDVRMDGVARRADRGSSAIPVRLADNFPLAVKHLLTPQAYRQKVLLDLIAPDGEIGPGYRHLAELVLRGLVGTILTTNFDICLPRALNDKRPHIRHVAEVNRGPDDFREFDIFNRAQIVWLHGKAEQYTDKNLTEEVQQLDPKLVGCLAAVAAIDAADRRRLPRRRAFDHEKPARVKAAISHSRRAYSGATAAAICIPTWKRFGSVWAAISSSARSMGSTSCSLTWTRIWLVNRERWERRRPRNRGISTIGRWKARRSRISTWISPCAQPRIFAKSSGFGSRRLRH